MTDYLDGLDLELAERAAIARAELAHVHAEQRRRADSDFRAAHRELAADMAAKMARLSELPSWAGAGTVVTPSRELETAEAARAARERTRAILGTSV